MTFLFVFFPHLQPEIFAGLLDAKLSDFEFPDDFVLDVRFELWLFLASRASVARYCLIRFMLASLSTQR